MQISTSVLPTLTAVTLMRFAAILLDRTHAHVKEDSQGMEKHALVSCRGVVKNASKRCACPYFLYSIFTFKHVENDGHMTAMVRDNNNLIKVILEIYVSRKISLKLVLQNCQAQPVTN